jgi:hypothetical protein
MPVTRNGSPYPYPDPALRVRVDNLTEDLHSLRSDIRDIQSAISSQFNSLRSEMADRNKPQYALQITLYGAILATVTTVGWLAYSPINRDTDRLMLAVSKIADNSVNQKQYSDDSSRMAGELSRIRTDNLGNVLRDRYQSDQASSARNMDERFRSVDRQLDEMRQRGDFVRGHFLQSKDFEAQHNDLKAFLGVQVDGLQRQITGLSERLNQTWNARDALIDLRDRLNKLEHR